MNIIDSHAHMGPGLLNHESRPLLDAASADAMIRIMDDAEIERACTFAPLLEGGEFEDLTYERANGAIYEASRRFPKRIIGFCRINPNFGQAAIDEMKRCHEEYGFQGLKLHPDWEYFYINSPVVKPIVEFCQSVRWPVFLHTGYYPLSHPTLLLPVAEAFPSVNFIMAHLSYAHTADAIIVANQCPNVYLEPSGNATAQAIHGVLRVVGPRQFIYGSDLPYTDPLDVQMKIMLQPGLTEGDKDLIMGKTIARLVGLVV